MAGTIKQSMADRFVVSGTWAINGSMRPFKGATDEKRFRLNVRFDGVKITDIINKALEPTKIAWVNNVGRKHFDTYTDNQVIEVDFKSPGKTPDEPPEIRLAREAKEAGVDINDKVALTEYIMSKLTK